MGQRNIIQHSFNYFVICYSLEFDDTDGHDTRSDFNVHPKADISQLNLPHGTKKNKKVKKRKTTKQKTGMLKS